MRIYGTYTHRTGARGPEFALDLEPSVRMRARRLFGKLQLNRTHLIVISDTDEVCRDLAWFADRFPLEPADPASEARLRAGSAEHARVEAAVAEIMAGGIRDLVRFDVEPQKTPRPYQLTAIELLRLRKRVLLTDEVGLGKTLTGLLAAAHTDARPALIVPPTHLPPRWETEAQETFPDLSFAIAKKSTPSMQLYDGIPDLLVVPYSKLDGWAGSLAGHVKTVIFDEVQELRNGAATDKGMAAALVSKDADYVLGLTATPVYNYGGEIWSIYDILAPDELGSREEFTREWGTYSGGKLLVQDPHALGAHLRDEGLMLGRTRKQVGRELPKTIKAPVLVDSHHKELDRIAASSKALAETIVSDTSSVQDRFQAAGELDMQMRRATGVDKAPFVADYVAEILESEDRVVVWGWHRDVYDIWTTSLERFHPRLYTGSESPKQKREAELAFTAPCRGEDGELLEDACRVLIMSLRSGAGVDGLQKVSRVGVFGELDWSPQVHEQAIGRLRRDGMGDDPPVIYFLYSAEGSDPAVLDVLNIKRQQSEPLVSPDGKLLANATTDTGRGRRIAEQLLNRAGQNGAAR